MLCFLPLEEFLASQLPYIAIFSVHIDKGCMLARPCSSSAVQHSSVARCLIIIHGVVRKCSQYYVFWLLRHAVELTEQLIGRISSRRESTTSRVQQQQRCERFFGVHIHRVE